jgi:prepilin-type N-terminal cleavage/methylation domain-containing protein
MEYPRNARGLLTTLASRGIELPMGDSASDCRLDGCDMRSRRRTEWKSAFTLIELLCVIAVIAILVALTFPALSKTRAKVDDAKCTSNLHQIGCAILAYAIDHNDYFPGPLLLGQPAWYAHKDASLASYLETYMSLTPIQAWPHPPNAYTCPAFQKVATSGTIPMYGAEYIYDANGQMDVMRPWGYPSSSVFNAVENEPIRRMSDVAAAIDPTNGQPISLSKAVALHDIDQTEYLPTASPPGWMNTLPAKPVHGDHQNALFFDWHVGRINPVTQAAL